VPGYALRRHEALEGVKGRVVAVVSFREYRREREARAMPAGTDLLGLLVAAPGGVPVVVTDDLRRWAVRERAEAQAELAALAAMLETTRDPAFRAEFEADMDRLRRMPAGLDPRAPVVFGAVLVAHATALRALADQDHVRLVDVVSKGVPADLTVLAGLRPEETDRAGSPRTRPLS
jgi:hypothetical protein